MRSTRDEGLSELFSFALKPSEKQALARLADDERNVASAAVASFRRSFCGS